jgi:hypothetical protein
VRYGISGTEQTWDSLPERLRRLSRHMASASTDWLPRGNDDDTKETGETVGAMADIIPFTNGDFRDGEAGWNIVKDRGDSGSMTPDYRFQGRNAYLLDPVSDDRTQIC